MTEEQAVRGCFLCEPDRLLVFSRTAECVAMCGLGPVVPYYSLVATNAHIRSASDAIREGVDILAAVKHVVSGFNARGFECIIAEHGRVPVCAERIGHERHCYHAHMLIFPDARWPTIDVEHIFHKTYIFNDMEAALIGAPVNNEYYLLSRNLEKTVLYCEPKAAPRRFLRALVASEEGVPEKADWRINPDREAALGYARELRSAFGDSNNGI